MLSGIQALQNINSSLQTVKNDIHRIDAQLSGLSNQLANNHRQHALAIQGIAKIRLGTLVEGSSNKNTLIEHLSLADKQALTLLDERHQAISKLESDIQQQQQTQEKLEKQRQQLLENANHIANTLANKEAETQATLNTDHAYQTALTRAQEADSIADEAERKAQESAGSLEEKGKPYQADDLFMYLWDRHYGTADYKNYNPITRLLDAWVAHKAKYHNYRANYWNIQEIPKRLAQHAQGVREQAEALIIDVQTLEEKALKKNGANQLKHELEKAREKVEQCDNELSLVEEQENSLLNSRSQFASAQDSYMKKCLTLLQNALEHQSISGLRQLVAVSPSEEDNDLLKDLNHYQSNHNNIKQDMNGLRHAHDEKLKRLKELETVRNNFKRHHYDDIRSGFGNNALIGSALGQFLEGLVNGSELWRVIQQNQRHQDVGAWPDFGSGGLGNGRFRNVHRSAGSSNNNKNKNTTLNNNILNDLFNQQSHHQGKKTSPWHWPNSHHGGFRLPSSRSNNQGNRYTGGFKTGGSF